MSERNIRSWKDVEAAREAKELTAAEVELIACCQAGTVCRLNGGVLPSAPSDDCEVKSDLLRFLITGGDEAAGLRDIGVQLEGSYITGVLDLDFAIARGKTTMTACFFPARIYAHATEFQHLNLDRSHLSQGIFAQGVKVAQGIFLRKVQADGTLDFNSSKVGGSFEIIKAKLTPNAGPALDAEQSSVNRNFSLCETQLTGTASLGGSKIGGQLDCEAFDLGLEKDVAANRKTLNLQDVEAGGFYWRGVKRFEGLLDLNSAKFGVVVDDEDSWDKVAHLYLDQLRYDHLHDPHTIQMRLSWLAKNAQSLGVFEPQPYQQLAKVYREMGHDADYRRVMVAKEKLQNADERKRLKPFRKRLNWCVDQFYWHIAGYGFYPFKAVVLLTFLVILGAGISYKAWNSGDFAPNSDVILTSNEWVALAEDPDISNPAKLWSAGTGKGRDYETFHPFAYAFDVVVPLVDIGQQEAWAPSTTRGIWGKLLWPARWVLAVLGWLVTAVGAAAITGIIRRD